MFAILLVCWLGFGIFFFYSAFVGGVLVFPTWAAFLVLAFGAVGMGILAANSLDLGNNPFDTGASGTGAAALFAFLFAGSHICPRCNKWMSVSHRTLRSATYTCSGLGEKTEHCEHCMYHSVSTYTISRKTRSSHRSSSSRSSSGGGRSSGGGGGASW